MNKKADSVDNNEVVEEKTSNDQVTENDESRSDTAEAVTTDATVTSEEFDADNAPETVPQKKKFKMKKWQIALTAVGSVLLILIIVVLSIFLPILLRKVDNPIMGTSAINGYTRTETFLGINSYKAAGSEEIGKLISVEAVFPKSTSVTVDNGTAFTISNGNITTTDATGKVNVTVTPEEGKPYKQVVNVINGTNVFDYAQLKAVAALETPTDIILQNDIAFDYKESKGGIGATIDLKANIYGNTHKVDGTNFTKDIDSLDEFVKGEVEYDTMFRIEDKTGIEFNGVHVLAIDLKKEEFKHNELIDGGTQLQMIGSSDILVKNCVFEKAFKNISFKETTAKIEGNLFREVADGCLSVELTSSKANVLTIERNIMINPQVAGIIIFNISNKTVKNAQLTISGLEIYNWKNDKTAALMPLTEAPLDNIVNGLIQDNLTKDQYRKLMVKYEEEYWLHIGMVILSSGNGALNEPVINGTTLKSDKTTQNIPNIDSNDAYKKRQLPFGAFAGLLSVAGIKTANMVGYTAKPRNNVNLVPSEPAGIEINADMFDRIRG